MFAAPKNYHSYKHMHAWIIHVKRAEKNMHCLILFRIDFKYLNSNERRWRTGKFFLLNQIFKQKNAWFCLFFCFKVEFGELIIIYHKKSSWEFIYECFPEQNLNLKEKFITRC